MYGSGSGPVLGAALEVGVEEEVAEVPFMDGAGVLAPVGVAPEEVLGLLVPGASGGVGALVVVVAGAEEPEEAAAGLEDDVPPPPPPAWVGMPVSTIKPGDGAGVVVPCCN